MSEDPNGWVKNPPSQFVKIAGLAARPEINGAVGIVVGYQADRQRYLVVLPPNTAAPLSLKADNLSAAGYLDQLRAQYALVAGDARLRQQVNQILTKITSVTGLSPTLLAGGAGGLLIVLVYLLGFSRTLLLLTFVILTGMIVIDPAVVEGRMSLRTSAAQAPSRLGNLVRQSQLPGAQIIASNPLYLGLFTAGVVAFFVAGLWPRSSTMWSKAAASSTTTTHTLATAEVERYYKLGFDDATAGHVYGNSLPRNAQDTAERLLLDDELVTAAPPKPSLLTMSNVVSVFFLGRTIKDLAHDGQGGFNLQRLQQNVRTMEPWRLGLLGLSLYRLVSAVVQSL